MNNFIHEHNMAKAVLMIVLHDNIVNAYSERSRHTEIQTTLLETLGCFLHTTPLFTSQEIDSLLVKSAQSVLFFCLNKTLSWFTLENVLK